MPSQTLSKTPREMKLGEDRLYQPQTTSAESDEVRPGGFRTRAPRNLRSQSKGEAPLLGSIAEPCQRASEIRIRFVGSSGSREGGVGDLWWPPDGSGRFQDPVRPELGYWIPKPKAILWRAHQGR